MPGMNTNFRWLAALLLLGGLSSALTACTSNVESAHADQAVQGVTLRAHDIGFDMQRLQAQAGRPVALTYVNGGMLEHAFTVAELVSEERVRPGVTQVISFTPSKPGEYRFFCAILGHEAAGMSGILTVQ